MMNELEILGTKLKNLRRKRNLTLAGLGEKANCSISYLSQVERGQVSPTIFSFKKIATALDVNIMYFFDDSDSMTSYVVRTQERRKLTNPASKVVFELLKPAGLSGALEPLLIRYKPGANSGKHSHTHQGEECLFIIKGKLEYHLGDEAYLLEEGDSIWYPTNIEHRWKNPTKEETLAIRVTTPPSF
jgi:quercetin dioxygenase-like cupin family protein